jgi:hypothetical protein
MRSAPVFSRRSAATGTGGEILRGARGPANDGSRRCGERQNRQEPDGLEDDVDEDDATCHLPSLDLMGLEPPRRLCAIRAESEDGVR